MEKKIYENTSVTHAPRSMPSGVTSSDIKRKNTTGLRSDQWKDHMFVGFVKGHMISTLPLKDTLRRNMVGCTNVIDVVTPAVGEKRS